MSNESRAKFEEWYEKDHSGGIDSLSSDWDEERNCYKNHANHLAWKAYDSRQSEIDSLRAENERLKGIRPAFPPFPPDGTELQRYGIRWNGPTEPLAVEMDDGYWTPWHIANALINSNVRGK